MHRVTVEKTDVGTWIFRLWDNETLVDSWEVDAVVFNRKSFALVDEKTNRVLLVGKDGTSATWVSQTQLEFA